MKSPFAFASLALAIALASGSVLAQAGSTNAGNLSAATTKIDRSIEYHGGQVLKENQDVYFIAYGCWGQPGCLGSAVSRYNDMATLNILTDFMSTLGLTPYMGINSTYTDSTGQAATNLLIYGGMVVDNSYAHGVQLTEADLQAIIADQFATNALPPDPNGIFVILTSSDVTLVDGATQFCMTCCNLHGHGVINGQQTRYIFVGNPSRCPGPCGSSPNGAETPNGNYAADQMASWLAHALNRVLTDPHDDSWYDRNGLENAEKCEGTYGTTYTVTNPDGQPAQANMKLGARNFLLQQNWVNGKKGHCSMLP
jgi:hypothetical protein